MNGIDAGPSSSTADLEEGTALMLDFKKLQDIVKGETDVIPVAVQDSDTKEVLIVAYVNDEALAYTLSQGVAAFWSTSRNELWIKGATSGDKLELVEVRVNCEQNSLLYLVRPLGVGACHTRGADGNARSGCYYRRIELADGAEDGPGGPSARSWTLTFV